MTSEVLHAFAHDLRSYLRAAMTRSQLLERSAEASISEEERKSLVEIASSIGQADQLLSAFMRYVDAHIPQSFFGEAMSLDLVVRGVVLEMRPKFEKLGGTLNSEESLPQEAVPGSSRTILKELLENALKFRREESPHATIRCSVNGRISFCVEDNGIGIDKTYVEEIFSPFMRLHSRQAYSGYGLGLATCRALAELSSGSIECVARESGGSIFTCTFPRIETSI